MRVPKAGKHYKHLCNKSQYQADTLQAAASAAMASVPTATWSTMANHLDRQCREAEELQVTLTASWVEGPKESVLNVINYAALNEARRFLDNKKRDLMYDGEDDESQRIWQSKLYSISEAKQSEDHENEEMVLISAVANAQVALALYDAALTKAGRRNGGEMKVSTIRAQLEAFANQDQQGVSGATDVDKNITVMKTSNNWLRQKAAVPGISNMSSTNGSGTFAAKQELPNVWVRNAKGRFSNITATEDLSSSDSSSKQRRGRDGKFTTASSLKSSIVDDKAERQQGMPESTLLTSHHKSTNQQVSAEHCVSGADNDLNDVSMLEVSGEVEQESLILGSPASSHLQSAADGEEGQSREGDVPMPEEFVEGEEPYEQGEEERGFGGGDDPNDGDYRGHGGDGSDDDRRGRKRGGKKGSGKEKKKKDEDADDSDSALSSGDSQDSSNGDGGDRRRSGRGNFDHGSQRMSERYSQAEEDLLLYLYGKFPGSKLPRGVPKKIRRAFNKWLRRSGFDYKRRRDGLRQHARKLQDVNEKAKKEGKLEPHKVLKKRPASITSPSGVPASTSEKRKAGKTPADSERLAQRPKPDNATNDEPSQTGEDAPAAPARYMDRTNDGGWRWVYPGDPDWRDPNLAEAPASLAPAIGQGYGSAMRPPTAPGPMLQPPPPAPSNQPQFAPQPSQPPQQRSPESERQFMEAYHRILQSRIDGPIAAFNRDLRRRQHDRIFGPHGPNCGCGEE